MKWHYLPEKPTTSCYCIMRLKDSGKVIPATFICYETTNYITNKPQTITFFSSDGSGYEDTCYENDEIECWCSVDELVEVLDGDYDKP